MTSSDHHCKSCRHWGTSDEVVQPKTCVQLSSRTPVVGEHGGALFVSPVAGARTKTGAMFGCTLHEWVEAPR